MFTLSFIWGIIAMDLHGVINTLAIVVPTVFTIGAGMLVNERRLTKIETLLTQHLEHHEKWEKIFARLAGQSE